MRELLIFVRSLIVMVRAFFIFCWAAHEEQADFDVFSVLVRLVWSQNENSHRTMNLFEIEFVLFLSVSRAQIRQEVV
jgi:hypothetical protein